MTRKKVDLAYITNDSKRKTTLRKRKTGSKIIGEISVLCGVEACAIIYTPNNPHPEVWPSNWGVQSVLSRFRGVSELEQSKKMLSQESFMRKKVIKAQEQLKKLKYENRKKEMTIHMFHHFNGGNIFDNVNMIDLNDISYLIYQKLEEIKMNMNMIQAQEVTQVVENGGEIMTQGEQELLNPVQGPETKLDDMQALNWFMDIINFGGDEDEMFTLEDVNVQSKVSRTSRSSLNRPISHHQTQAMHGLYYLTRRLTSMSTVLVILDWSSIHSVVVPTVKSFVKLQSIDLEIPGRPTGS
ncbi:Agamous-like MADS-box protein AGL80, partial [Mucuna pruriens]